MVRSPLPIKSELASELNEALGKNWFSGEGKISIDIAQMLPDKRAARRYVDIWRRFIKHRQANRALKPTARN